MELELLNMELEIKNMELEYKLWNWNYIIWIWNIKYRKTAILVGILCPKNCLKTK